MTTETTETQTTQDAEVKETGDSNDTGAVTHTETTKTEAHKEKTFTQAEVDAMFQKRLKTAVKSELKKAIGENSDAPTVEELQRQLAELSGENRSFKANKEITNYFSDAKNKLSVKSIDLAGASELVGKYLEFDEEGSISNLAEAVESAKRLAPSLFANNAPSINAGFGRGKTAAAPDMNDLIRSGFARK